MPEQPIILNGKIVSDKWTLIPKDTTAIPSGEGLVLPYALWKQHRHELNSRTDIGVWLDSDELPEKEQAQSLASLPIIAINFPVFTDGRGFSIARLLRERFGYEGELRATGYLLRDQLCYLKRCGFNSFALREGSDYTAALSSLDDFTEYYQTCVNEPLPLFRRQ